MINLIKQILRLPATADKYLAKMYARVAWLFIWFAVYLLTLGPFATGHGFGWINFIPLFIWVITWTIAGLHPRALAALVAIRLPDAPKKRKIEAVKNALSDTLPKVFGEIGFWPLVILFYLAMIDASLKPSLIWLIYAAALVYAMYTIRYQKEMRFFKRLSVTVAVIMIVISLIRFIEPENQVHWFTFNVSASLKASPWDKQLTKYETTAKELQQGYEHQEWQTLIAKARNGKITAAEYQTKLAELEEKRSARTIPGKIWGGVKNVAGWIGSLRSQKNAIASTPPTPAVSIKEPCKPTLDQLVPVGIVAEKFVSFDHWDLEKFGYVDIVHKKLLPAGRYELEVVSSNFEQFFNKDGNPLWISIPPEGLTGMYVPYSDKLPFPNERVGTRIMKVDGSEPEKVGRCICFSLNSTEPVTISISTNMMQNTSVGGYEPKYNFIQNKGGDKVILIRLS